MVKLLPCQTQAADEWVKKGGRGIISASVGSGKTFVAAECFRRSKERENGPMFYLTTRSAMNEQIKKLKSYELEVIEIVGTTDTRTSFWKNPENKIYVGTLESVTCPDKEWEWMRKVNWKCGIIDEGDRLTAGASKRNRRLLTLTPRHRLMMSGTILKNGLKDAYFPVMFLSQTAPWKNWTDFKNRELLFNNPMLPAMMTGIRDEEHLASLVKPLVIEMVNPDAPKELVAEIVSVEMGEKQRKAYEDMKRDLLLECVQGTLTISNHAVLNLRLRQLVTLPEAIGCDAPSAKEHALQRLLEKVKGKTIVFTSFATVAKILAERYKAPVIEGAVSANNRQRILESAPDVLFATSAAERGVDCPWVTNIISLDAGFTPAVMRQRSGRATRYGRSGEAKLYLLQCPGTVDETSEARIILRKLKEARKIYEKN